MITENPESFDLFEIQELMQNRGYWMVLKSPFEPRGSWFCGFTPLGASGWNGQPDYHGTGSYAQEAAVNALKQFEAQND